MSWIVDKRVFDSTEEKIKAVRLLFDGAERDEIVDSCRCVPQSDDKHT